MKLRSVTTLTAFMLMLVLFYSHHYILVPDKFIYREGDSMKMHLMVGEPFDFEFERELQHYLTPHFMRYTKSDSTDLIPLMPDNSTPVLKTLVNFEGLALIEMQRNASTVEQTPGAFQKYLAEEKITGIEFDSAKWKKPVVIENYSRCIKSLFTSGKPGNENLYRKITGQRLELLLMTNPYLMEPNQRLTVKLLLEGKPLADHWVTASAKNESGSLKEVSAKTDKKGMVSFEVALNTVYFVHSVYMMKLKDSKADYESVWASYSFQTAGK